MILSEQTVPKTFHHTGPQVLCIPAARLVSHREKQCAGETAGPQDARVDSVHTLTETVWTQGPTRETNLSCENRNEDWNSNLSKSWKIFKPKILRHDGTLNHESLAACSSCSIYLWLWHTSLGHPESPDTEQEAQHQHTLPCDSSVEKCCLAQVGNKPTHKPAARNLYHNKGLNSKEQYALQQIHSKDVYEQRPSIRRQQLEMFMRIRGKPRFGINIFCFPAKDPEIDLKSFGHSVLKRKNLGERVAAGTCSSRSPATNPWQHSAFFWPILAPGTHMMYTYDTHAKNPYTRSKKGNHYHRTIAENKTVRTRAVVRHSRVLQALS